MRVGTRDVTLLPIGGVVRQESIPEKPRQELLVALAGPAVNAVIVSFLLIWIFLFESGLAGLYFSLSQGGFATNLLFINLLMIGFNTLPVFPMDGGGVLRAFLASRMNYTKATRIASALDERWQSCFCLLGCFGSRIQFSFLSRLWFGLSQDKRLA